MLDLTELRKLEEAAAGEPWEIASCGRIKTVFGNPRMDESLLIPARVTSGCCQDSNQKFIIASRNYYRQLLDIVEAAKRSEEHSKKNVEVGAGDEEFPEFLRECVRLSNVVKKLLEDVEIGNRGRRDG